MGRPVDKPVPAWSYSSIKTYDQCPKKYYHLKVARDVKDTGSEAMLYGEMVHKAIEDFFADGTPIPDKYDYVRGLCDVMDEKEGEKHAEIKLGLKRNAKGDYEACDFDDPDVWWRGIADLVILNGTEGWCIDWKTGKSAKYADVKQLDMLAAAMFVKYPELQVIKSALAFVVADKLVRKIHKRELLEEYAEVFADPLDRLASSMHSGVWNPIQGPLCGWCPVDFCPHHRPRF